MAKPYSLDLRLRVVAQAARGMTTRGVAELNDIEPPTVSVAGAHDPIRRRPSVGPSHCPISVRAGIGAAQI